MQESKTSGKLFPQQTKHTERVLGKSLPANIDAERSVLGAILISDDTVSEISDILLAEDFYSPAHQTIFASILSLSQRGQRIDMLTLQNDLDARHQLDGIGGIGYLMELAEDIPSVGLVVQHAHIIKEKKVLRDLISSAAEIITSCYDSQKESIDSVLDNAEKKIFQIANKRTAPSFVQLDVCLKNTFQHLANVRGLREGVTGVPTGFNQFDEMTSGMQRGDLLILAARPSMGKTTLALNIALNAAKSGAGVGIFSYEMSAEQLVLRMLSSESGIPHQKIRNALITSDEWVELTNTAAQIAELKFFIDDTPSMTILELRAKARKLKAKEDVKLIVIDYLQLISGSRRTENRTQEISEISRSLKALAKELDVPVLALSQLSRQLENRMDKRPLLSDLRESGAIEQDGDVIFFVYRDVIYHPDTEQPDLSEIIIGKQRNGPVGTTYARFSGDTTTFEDLPHDGAY